MTRALISNLCLWGVQQHQHGQHHRRIVSAFVVPAMRTRRRISAIQQHPSSRHGRSSGGMYRFVHTSSYEAAHLITESSSSSSTIDTSNMNENRWLEVSHLGLDPSTNRYHAPIVYHEQYSFDGWPTSHTFPMDKFYATAQALLSKTDPRHARPLVRSSTDFFRPLDLHEIPDEWFHNARICSDFYQRFMDGKLSTEEARYIGFREQCHRPELIRRTILEVAGTVLTCQLACQWGIASHVAGGTHHAHPTGGAGFTVLNDIAVAVQYLCDKTPTTNKNDLRDHLKIRPSLDIQKVLVIDCDVHQGDGTAKFNELWNNDVDRAGRLFTLSLHCASNYPHPKATSTYDVGLPDNCNDEEYLRILEESVDRALKEVQPDFVVYDAGVDVYEHDKLGRLSLTMEGMRARDRFVLERCVDLEIPVAAVVGGGYDVDVNTLARRHAIVHEECAYVWRKNQMWKRR
jgi:acetoin utilization deacetylase AcuC-like enzyme